MNQSLETGRLLGVDFAGYPVSMIKHEGSYYVECKKVAFLYDDYLSFLEDPRKDVLGYNLQGKPCQIKHMDGVTRIGCLKDTTEKFNSIITNVKKTIQDDKKAK